MFSAGSANDPTKNTVELLITGGYFNIYKCTDSLFQGKSSQGNYKIVNATFLATSPDSISEMFQEEDSTNNPINCYNFCE